VPVLAVRRADGQHLDHIRTAENIRFTCSADALKTLREHRRGESDLLERDGSFYLVAVCDIPEPDPYEPGAFIGVDLGIANIATTSTGYKAAGRNLNRHRRQQRNCAGSCRPKAPSPPNGG
jgi:transposase